MMYRIGLSYPMYRYIILILTRLVGPFAHLSSYSGAFSCVRDMEVCVHIVVCTTEWQDLKWHTFRTVELECILMDV